MSSDAQQISDFRIWVGSETAAKDVKFLRKNNIGGILDIGSSNKKYFSNIRYSKFQIDDSESAPIDEFFDEAHKFIDLVRTDPMAHVLVHCTDGSSLSPTIIASWLMKKFRMQHNVALALIKKYRLDIRPNSGFVRKLDNYSKTS